MVAGYKRRADDSHKPPWHCCVPLNTYIINAFEHPREKCSYASWRYVPTHVKLPVHMVPVDCRTVGFFYFAGCGGLWGGVRNENSVVILKNLKSICLE